ncbi:PD-(D/E)XK nuclease family protein [Blattabacterium cuenoti]|uniref:PD-(D/E)XK nuclease family protein n=1 Tax=Blattabacterium cuenoti TaxID=1653831 RepID=UPI001EEBA6FD|nr:PD-(D/E)XK nuclease family protein [Blattabacterium cuenoti]
MKKKFLLVSSDNFIAEYIRGKYYTNFNNFSEIYTMEKLMEKISGLSPYSINHILFYFFCLLRKGNSVLAKNLNDFLNWAPNILNDFEDLDIHLINIECFFSYIISTEKIKKWHINPLEKEDIEEKKKFLFWEEIYKYYNLFQDKLLRKGIGYKGLLFRIAISHLKKFLSKKTDIKIILLIYKFNLLTEYEKLFVKKILQINQKSIQFHSLCDIQLKNTYDFCINFQDKPIPIYNQLNNNLKIISVSNEIEQVKIVEELISKLIKNRQKPSKIVLILGDAYLTFPLLHSIKKISGIYPSISIDYPIKNLSIHYTLDSIFQLLLKKEKLKNFSKKDILRVLLDGYIQKFFLKKDLSFIEKLEIENSNFISEENINKYLFNNNLNIIFQIPTHNAKKAFFGIMSFIRKLKNLLFINTKKHLLELKFLSELENYMQRIKILIRKTECSFFGIKDLFNIYQQFIKTEKISYIQKNPKGVHLIGFLGSYFGNVETTIMTSVNEGIIPPDKEENYYKTLIPYDIRKKFNLSFSKNNENFYSHHFRNILQNSKNIYLIYKNKPDELNSGEKSRFIHQIEMISNFSIKERKNHSLILSTKTKISPIVIKKTNSMIQRLHELATHGLSPSSIHLYNYNPLLFYYKKVLGLNIEKISIKQIIGKIIHKILEVLYHPIKGNFITIDGIDTMKKNYEFLIKKIISENKKNPLTEENNLLINSIVSNYIKNFILWEEKTFHKGHKIFIKELECSVSTALDIGCNKKVNLYGIIDRIDECDGITRILDYKIGISKMNKIHISLNKREKIFQDPHYGNIMQLLIYMYLWFKSFHGYKKNPPVIAIVSPEKHKKNSILTIPINFFNQITYENYVKEFLPYLMNRIYEILDPKIPIEEKKFNDF